MVNDINAWWGNQMIKMRLPAAAAKAPRIRHLHLCLAQKASWFILLDLFWSCWEMDSNLTAFLTVISTFSSLWSTFSMLSFIISWSLSNSLLRVYFLSGLLLELKRVWVMKIVRIAAWILQRRKCSYQRWWRCRSPLWNIYHWIFYRFLQGN